MNLDDLISQIPIGQVAQMLGISEEQAAETVRAAVPALVGGMAANANDPDGAASLAKAFDRHADDVGGLGGFDLGSVDTDDGSKIVDHIFGSNRDEVANRLSGQAQGISGGLMLKLLPLLAPLLMKWLGGMFKNGGGLFGGKTADAGAGSSGGSAGGGALSDAFDEMTKGDDAASRIRQRSTDSDDYADHSDDRGQDDEQSSGGGGLGDLLGGLLGGNKGGGGGGLGDLLGGLLGGGSR